MIFCLFESLKENYIVPYPKKENLNSVHKKISIHLNTKGYILTRCNESKEKKQKLLYNFYIITYY